MGQTTWFRLLRELCHYLMIVRDELLDYRLLGQTTGFKVLKWTSLNQIVHLTKMNYLISDYWDKLLDSDYWDVQTWIRVDEQPESRLIEMNYLNRIIKTNYSTQIILNKLLIQISRFILESIGEMNNLVKIIEWTNKLESSTLSQ